MCGVFTITWLAVVLCCRFGFHLSWWISLPVGFVAAILITAITDLLLNSKRLEHFNKETGISGPAGEFMRLPSLQELLRQAATGPSRDEYDRIATAALRYNEGVSLSDQNSYRNGRYQEAITAYLEAYKLVPNGAEIVDNLSLAYFRYGNFLSSRESNKEKAVEMYRRSLEIVPGNPIVQRAMEELSR